MVVYVLLVVCVWLGLTFFCAGMADLVCSPFSRRYFHKTPEERQKIATRYHVGYATGLVLVPVGTCLASLVWYWHSLPLWLQLFAGWYLLTWIILTIQDYIAQLKLPDRTPSRYVLFVATLGLQFTFGLWVIPSLVHKQDRGTNLKMAAASYKEHVPS